MVKLKDVFGITRSIPEYTYVDRSLLDSEFIRLLESDIHIVIRGTSKQGKTVLRKKNLPEESCIVIRCQKDTTVETIYTSILSQIGAKTEIQTSKKTTNSAGRKSGLSLNVQLPSIFSGGVKDESSKSSGYEEESISKNYQANDDIKYIASFIKTSGKRVILEDFHYPEEKIQEKFSFILKSFYDEGIFFIILGIWPKHNLLTYYNPDLSGRIKEINISWTNEELGKVISQGEDALNIDFSNELKSKMIEDARGNVGLLQRLLEQYCLQANISETQLSKVKLDNINYLEKGRREICTEEHDRYMQFSRKIADGMRKDNVLRMYEHILRVAVEASDDELIKGLSHRTIEERVRPYQSKARQTDLTQALNRFNKIQVSSGVSNLVFYYNENLRSLQLVDHGLLFFRHYGNPIWPWEDD